MKHHIALGRKGERIAADYLVSKSYRILQRNWRYKRAEIDLIASIDNLLVFCEVKARSSTLFGEPEIFVDKRKQALLTDAAVVYMDENEYSGEFRFDIIGIVFKNDLEYQLKHSIDAFFPGFEGFI